MSFVDQLAPFAFKHGLANGVLPSLIIAQGILESGSGTSELATKANNLFGIKAGAGWTGATYNKRTSEQDKDGNVYYINAAFRKYPSYEGCVIDLVNKYQYGLPGEKSNRYAAVLNQTDYKKATTAVKAAGYATDVKYPDKLNKLIVQHNLTKYDRKGDSMATIKDLRPITPRTNGTRKLSAIKSIARHHSAGTTGSWATFWPYWHKTKGWGTGGYHEIILRDGTVELCYDPEEITNGVGGQNSYIYNICLVGNGSFTDAQEKTFDERARHWMKQFGLSAKDVKGHNEFPGQATSCPGTDMNTVRARLSAAPATKEDDEMKFTSGTLRKEWETFLGSKAQREIAVKEAVKQGYNAKWIKDLEEGKIADGDVAALAIGALIRANK